MLLLEQTWRAACSVCGNTDAVETADYEEAHVELRMAGWTRSAAGVQLCPPCTKEARVAALAPKPL